MKTSISLYQLKRRAKGLAREQHIPLHEALDRVARHEGYSRWSLLASKHPQHSVPEIFSRLNDHDMVILGARPGHGKTLLGIRLLLDAIQAGWKGVYFTLEWTEKETHKRIRALGGNLHCDALLPTVVTSDKISASFMIDYLEHFPRKSVIVIDYLQLLDQQRHKPILSIQLAELRAFADETGSIIAIISQIDRTYRPETKSVPDMKNLRLPNPIDPGVFTKAFFLHAGKLGIRNIP
ncbi:hypothetical protein LMG33818_000744 [Halomonadaceae bacterium LMG 33818]|uniref:DNA helicase n=1 Tax=Cernens ardua TaxID=3402176 RepID=UPI003EDB8C10